MSTPVGISHELAQANIAFERQVGIPIVYKGIQLEGGFRADILVDRQIVVEIKAVTSLTSIHDAQMLTYLRMSGLRIGLIFNFHARLLKEGLRRFVV